jgi:hypothetical protein
MTGFEIYGILFVINIVLEALDPGMLMFCVSGCI